MVSWARQMQTCLYPCHRLPEAHKQDLSNLAPQYDCWLGRVKSSSLQLPLPCLQPQVNGKTSAAVADARVRSHIMPFLRQYLAKTKHPGSLIRKSSPLPRSLVGLTQYFSDKQNIFSDNRLQKGVFVINGKQQNITKTPF